MWYRFWHVIFSIYHIFRLKYRCFVYALSMIVPSLYKSARSIEYWLVRKDMDVNEQERLSNITPKTQHQAKEQRCHCCSAFHSHSMVFNNEYNSYPKMIVKRPLGCSLAVHFILGSSIAVLARHHTLYSCYGLTFIQYIIKLPTSI